MKIKAHGPSFLRLELDECNKEFIRIEISDNIRSSFAYMNRAQISILRLELDRLYNAQRELGEIAREHRQFIGERKDPNSQSR